MLACSPFVSVKVNGFLEVSGAVEILDIDSF
jgi:hypothetical protein